MSRPFTSSPPPNVHPARGTRPSQQAARNSSSEQQASRRAGLTPITTSSAIHNSFAAANRPVQSPVGASSNYTAGRQIASRQSSTSSASSFVSPSGSIGPLHTGSRSRNATAAGSPRLAASLASLSAGVGSAGGGTSRLARHSPSLSLSNSAGSPASPTGTHSASGSSSQLTSLVVTQLNILLSTIKEDTDRAKWETQAEKIRRLVNDSGMEVSTTYFRRLLQSNASTIFPGAPRAPAGQDNAGSYQLLVEEMQKLVKDSQQADKIAQSLDTSEGDLFRDFDLATFVEHFRLDPISKTALVLSCRTVSKADLRSKADAVLNANTISNFFNSLANPQATDPDSEPSPLVLASIVEHLIQDPPQNWGEEQRDSLFYAIRLRYNNLRSRVPPAIEAAMVLDDLLSGPDSRLANHLQRAGPRSTASLEACKQTLSGVDLRDFTYLQVACALLYTVIAGGGEVYDPQILVEGIRQHRAGRQIDWTDVVVQGFDREHLRVTRKQFLALYNALLPLAREYANFDIQTLWGGQWQHAETQLSFVVAFLQTTSEELDVMQIPNLRQAFDLTDFATASDSVRAFAEQAIKHPLVSRDATEALFTMIFRSQETYNLAQHLGIPDSVINQNMTIFVCAASAVPKPWAPLQDQALKQLFYPFLTKLHDNYDFVMHAVWQHDKQWTASRMVEFYGQDQMLLPFIFEHGKEHGWLEPLFHITNQMAVDLVTYAFGKGESDLEQWAQQHIGIMGPQQFAAACADFLKRKMDDEAKVQREGTAPTTAPLTIKTVHALLLLIVDNTPDDSMGPLYRQCLQLYPRLFNYGQDEKRDAIIDANGTGPNGSQQHTLPDEATRDMEERYKEMYGGSTNPDSLVTDLNRLKISEDPAEQDLFAAMLFGLFEEYNCFGEYPNEALATTAVLFGGLVSYHVLHGIAEQAAIFMIFEAVSEYGPEDPMYRFGLQALIHVLPRLKEWPHVAQRILQTPSLQGTQAIAAAETALKEASPPDVLTLNGDGLNGITNGVVDEEFPAVSEPPAFTAIQVDPPLRENFYEEPDEDTSDKVMFVLNNVSKRNFEEKFKEIDGALEEKYHQWFAHYLVDELAKSQPNFQGLYLNVLEKFDKKMLWAEVFRETYMSCQKMLNAQSTMDSSHERATLKNLAVWLGSITLARNLPILHRNLSFKDLLLEGYDTQRLLVAIPFACKTLSQAAHSKVFRPPNPWIMELLGLMSELYHCMELKLNMKFEIEMLCREFQVEIKNIEPADIIRSRPLVDHGMLQNYIPDGGPDAFGDMALMGLSKRGPNERFSPEAVIQAVPDLGSMLQIPQAVGSLSQNQLRGIFVNAAQQAIYEIIAPVVERSVTIASISTSELVQKDFVTEGDETKMRNAAHTMVKSLSGSLALVTCKEPLRMSITNNIRLLARGLPEQLPEGQILMFVNDNIDTVCGLVEGAAEDHSLAEIDLQLEQAMNDRKAHNEQRPNEPFSQTPVSRWATLIPDPYRQDQNGLNRQQLSLYEDFGRQARITPAAHANNVSQDSNRQLPDVLSEGYLPSLPTPAEAPAMPRPTQQQRLPDVAAQTHHHVNGYIDQNRLGQRIAELIEELQQTSREAKEEHISEIGEGAAIRRVYGQLVSLIESTPQQDTLALLSGQQCLSVIYTTAQKRLEIEVFVRLLMQLCRMSVPAGRHLTMQLATSDDDRMYNATAAVSLVNEGLLDLQQVDSQISRAIKQRRIVVLPFLKDILEELLLVETPTTFRVDFVLTYEALSYWLQEDPGLELGREIMSKLQLPASQINGMPSPESETNNIDQLVYIFEEWVRLQKKDLSEHAHLAFAQQLYSKRVISEPKEAMTFFRTAIETSYNEFERISSIPYGTQSQAFIYADSLAKLIVILVLNQSPVDGEAQATKPAKTLEAILRLIVLIMSDHHNKHRERWNPRVYYRLFSSMLCEFHDRRHLLAPQQHQNIHNVFAQALLVLQPRYLPGFQFPWLALLGHRLFVPACLAGTGRTSGSWDMYSRLLTVLFQNLTELLSIPHSPPAVQDFFRGVMRFFTMLHHDYPEFLIENHMQLNASIPVQCLQLQNIVNSAVSRAVFNDQPDPFTPGLKINRLEQVRQAPAVHSDVGNVLNEAGIKSVMEHVCSGNDLSEQDFSYLLASVDREDGQISPILHNALILYIGMNATSASSVFSSGAAPARLLERLLRESRPEARFHLVSAMVNQVRYVNAHTHYFSTALQHMFSVGSPQVQEQIMRVLCERLMVPRPHPWGLIVIMLELVKNQTYDIWSLPWMKTAPQVESMLTNLAQSQEHRLTRSPMGAMM